MAWLKFVLTAALVAYVATFAIFYIFQRSFIYLPDNATPMPPPFEGFAPVAVEAGGAGPLRSLWKPPAGPDDPVILHFHGNAGSVATRAPGHADLAAGGAGVLAAGYPGYGENPGKPGEDAFYRAAEAHYDWLLARGYRPSNIVIVGQSLGSGVAVWLARRKDAAGLILEAPFTSLGDMAQRTLPIFPARALVKDRYPNIARIGGIDMPLAWMHGTRDDLIPYAMGERLYAAAAQPKCAFPFEGGGHNDLWLRGIGALIAAQAAAFVEGAGCAERPERVP